MKQIVFYVIGAGFIGLLLYFDLEQLEKLSLYVLIAGVLSLLLLRVAPESIAPIKNGAKSWFQIGYLVGFFKFIRIFFRFFRFIRFQNLKNQN